MIDISLSVLSMSSCGESTGGICWHTKLFINAYLSFYSGHIVWYTLHVILFHDLIDSCPITYASAHPFTLLNDIMLHPLNTRVHI